MKRVFAWFLCLSLVGFMLCGCESFTSFMDSDEEEEPEILTLERDVVLYEEPDGTSEKMGSIKAGKEVEYISTKRIDGVRWYETELGWFALFEMGEEEESEELKGHVILTGFAAVDLDLLSSSGSSASVIGALDAGTYVEIYQIRDLWAQTEMGWVVLENVYIPGHIGNNSGWCLTLKNYLGCYSNPSFSSTKLTEYSSMQRVKVYESIDIDGVLWGYTDSGWLCLDDTYVEGTTGEGACRVKVVDRTALNVRVGPGTGYDVIRTLDVGSYTDVLTQVYNGTNYWGFVGDGWIYMGLVEVQE